MRIWEFSTVRVVIDTEMARTFGCGEAEEEKEGIMIV